MSKSITLTHGILTLGQTLPRAVLHQRSLRPHRYHCPTVERPQWRGCQAEMVRDHVPVGLAAVQLLWAFTPIQRPREMFHANPGGGGTKSGKRNCIKNLSRNSSVCFTHWNRLKFNLHSKLTNIWWTAFALKFDQHLMNSFCPEVQMLLKPIGPFLTFTKFLCLGAIWL